MIVKSSSKYPTMGSVLPRIPHSVEDWQACKSVFARWAGRSNVIPKGRTHNHSVSPAFRVA